MITDVSGNDLQPDDRIAVAFRAGNSASLRVGKVVGFGTKKSYPSDLNTILVEWTGEGSGWDAKNMAGKTSAIDADLKRFVRL